MTKKKAKSIAISSVKGGVGKSTFTIWLAGIYASMNKKVLILDMDLYSGAIAVSLDLKCKKNVCDLINDLVCNHFTKTDNYVTSFSEYISVLASPKDPRDSSKIDFKYFKGILKYLEREYDVILIDTNHVFNQDNIHILDNCDKVIYLVANDLISIKNTRSLVDVYKDIEKKNYLLVLNNSLDKDRNYYSLLDIKVMARDNIDYVIPRSMHIKNIDKFVMDGNILTLEKRFVRKNKEGMKALEKIALHALKD